MEMLEANYKTWCAQNNVPVEDGPVEQNGDSVALTEENQKMSAMDEDTEWNGFDADEQDEEDKDQLNDNMEIDNEELPTFFQDEDRNVKAKSLNAKPGSKRNRKGKVAMLIKEKVNRILDETELGDKRARMCDEGDFLKLLWAFNKEGIHFS